MSSPYPSAPKRLERSTTDKFLAGVCGGVARYLNMDPTLVRVLWVILTLVLGGAPLIVYLVMMFVVPEDTARPGYPTPVNGPQGQPGWTPYPQQHQSPHDQPYPPAASPGPAPQAPSAPNPAASNPAGPQGDQQGDQQAVWGAAGAPWEQPDTSPAGSGFSDDDAANQNATTTDHDVAPANQQDGQPAAESDPEHAAEPDTENPADHNDEPRGQQPVS